MQLRDNVYESREETYLLIFFTQFIKDPSRDHILNEVVHALSSNNVVVAAWKKISLQRLYQRSFMFTRRQSFYKISQDPTCLEYREHDWWEVNDVVRHSSRRQPYGRHVCCLAKLINNLGQWDTHSSVKASSNGLWY